MLISGLALLSCLAVIGLGGSQLLAKFNYIEHEQAIATAQQVERAFEADLFQLSISVRNYAPADAGYNFVHRHIASYPQTMLHEALSGLQVDVVWMIDGNGHDLYSARVDEVDHAVVQPANQALLESLRPYRQQLAQLHLGKPRQRLLRVPDGLLAFDVAEITRTDKTGATGALLFFGRYIEIDELERARETSQTPVELLLGDTPQAAGIVEPTTAQWFRSSSEQQRFFALPLDRDRINVGLLLRDAAGQRIGMLQWQSPRNIAALGWHTSVSLLGTIASLLLVAVVVVGMLFSRLQKSALGRFAAQQRYTNIIRNLDESVVIVERSTLKIKEANPALQRRLGYSEAELLKCTLESIFKNLPLDDVRLYQQSMVHECQMLSRDGKLIDVEVTLSNVSDQHGELVCLLSRDITTRKRAEREATDHRRKLSRLANHDALTGLPNRLFLHARLPRLLRRLADSKRILAVFYVDMDHFKDINDSRGHPFGDKLLKIFSQRLKAAVGAHGWR